jgi:hypothetical protein
VDIILSEKNGQVDEKYLDEMWRRKNVTGMNYHSGLFVGWKDNLG